MKTNIKHYAVLVLVVFNIAVAGAVIGAWQMHTYDAKTASNSQAAVQTALKTVTVAQATSKVSGQ